MIEFFKNGGVFLFDEDDPKSEAAFYKIEDLMGEEQGQDITEANIDDDGEICVFYDWSVISEEQAIEKYKNGTYKKYF